MKINIEIIISISRLRILNKVFLTFKTHLYTWEEFKRNCLNDSRRAWVSEDLTNEFKDLKNKFKYLKNKFKEGRNFKIKRINFNNKYKYSRNKFEDSNKNFENWNKFKGLKTSLRHL